MIPPLPPLPSPTPTPPSDSGNGGGDPQDTGEGDSTVESSSGDETASGTDSQGDESAALNPSSTILAAQEEKGVQAIPAEVEINGVLPGQFLGFVEEGGESYGVRSTMRLTSASSGEPYSSNMTRAIRSLTEEVFQGRESFVGQGYLWNRLDDFHQKLETDVAVSSYSVGTVAVSSLAATAVYVLYSIKGGYLMASVLSQLPAWKFMDPLPIYDAMIGGSWMDEEFDSDALSGSDDETPPEKETS